MTVDRGDVLSLISSTRGGGENIEGGLGFLGTRRKGGDCTVHDYRGIKLVRQHEGLEMLTDVGYLLR